MEESARHAAGCRTSVIIIHDLRPYRARRAFLRSQPRPEGHAMSRYVTLGLTVLAGAALLEVALVPGIALGCAVVLAPKYLPKLGRRLRSRFPPAPRPAPAARPDAQADVEQPAALPELRIGQAIAKTVTFRIVVTTLDFTTNYVVIGELQTAAGLSAFNLVAGPLFYL